MSEGEPRSPCISVCVLDENDVCEGCFRTAAEITDWVMVSDDEKRDILRRCQERRDASFPVRLG